MVKPVIGICPSYNEENGFHVMTSYIKSVKKAGGIPFLLPPSDVVKNMCMNTIDGFLMPGGPDVNPIEYNESVNYEIDVVNPAKYVSDCMVLRYAFDYSVPFLGICYGNQLINVFFGGSLYQSLEDQVSGCFNHVMDKKLTHDVELVKGTRLESIAGITNIKVNSRHHQAIKKAGPNLIVNAYSSDGIIEGVEHENHNFILGVQWHPEHLSTEDSEKLFGEFIEKSAKR